MKHYLIAIILHSSIWLFCDYGANKKVFEWFGHNGGISFFYAGSLAFVLMITTGLYLEKKVRDEIYQRYKK